jgi:hypothetical protein
MSSLHALEIAGDSVVFTVLAAANDVTLPLLYTGTPVAGSAAPASPSAYVGSDTSKPRFVKISVYGADEVFILFNEVGGLPVVTAANGFHINQDMGALIFRTNGAANLQCIKVGAGTTVISITPLGNQ